MPQSMHANCVVIGTLGLLLQGDSGSGKSSLSDCLISKAKDHGNLGILVADDQVVLEASHGRLLARVPATIKGRLEVRGIGLVATESLSVARVHLLVTLTKPEAIERLPETCPCTEMMHGVPVPHVHCPQNDVEAGIRIVRWALRRILPGLPDYV